MAKLIFHTEADPEKINERCLFEALALTPERMTRAFN